MGEFGEFNWERTLTMKLPNCESAIVDLQKIRDYCLDPEHPRGKHKARVFEKALGITRTDSRDLKRLIEIGVLESDCEEGATDSYGGRYSVDMAISRNGMQATIRTAWIIKSNEQNPKLTTCYVK
jgi:hypothetical protein